MKTTIWILNIVALLAAISCSGESEEIRDLKSDVSHLRSWVDTSSTAEAQRMLVSWHREHRDFDPRNHYEYPAIMKKLIDSEMALRTYKREEFRRMSSWESKRFKRSNLYRDYLRMTFTPERVQAIQTSINNIVNESCQ